MPHREAPSCNGSQQESQKLTGGSARETPRVDAVECLSRVDEDDYERLLTLARQLERELNAKSRELEEANRMREQEWIEKGIASLQDQLERVLPHANRYLWLREHSWLDQTLIKSILNFGPGYEQTKPEVLDAAIDSALHHDGK